MKFYSFTNVLFDFFLRIACCDAAWQVGNIGSVVIWAFLIYDDLLRIHIAISLLATLVGSYRLAQQNPGCPQPVVLDVAQDERSSCALCTPCSSQTLPEPVEGIDGEFRYGEP